MFIVSNLDGFIVGNIGFYAAFQLPRERLDLKHTLTAFQLPRERSPDLKHIVAEL